MIPEKLAESSGLPELVRAVNALIDHLNPLSVADISGKLPRHPERTYGRRDLSVITQIVVHHVGVNADVGPRSTAAYHVRKGWPGIGYHYFVRSSGEMFQTQPLNVVSYHCGGDCNRVSVGVCLEGSFMKGRRPTPEQIQSLRALNERLGHDVYGHRDLRQTACPGDTWHLWKHLIVLDVRTN